MHFSMKYMGKLTSSVSCFGLASVTEETDVCVWGGGGKVTGVRVCSA